ncbi:Uncharacterised protein [Vibrio cholerae]|nr:Uncharacterised protein [Vibrio cholerae]
MGRVIIRQSNTLRRRSARINSNRRFVFSGNKPKTIPTNTIHVGILYCDHRRCCDHSLTSRSTLAKDI